MPRAESATARYGDGSCILFMVYVNVPSTTSSMPPATRRTKCHRRHRHFFSLTLTMNQDVQKIIRNILNDVRVELSDEFDRNFERQAFFNEAWQRRSSPTRPGGSILIDTGTLRQSISSRTTDNSITFCSTLPYAAIHNEGDEIKVTARMKRFFWHKYNEATGSFGRKKNGERRNDKRTVQLSTEAEFWKHMALMKEGKSIKIPRRRFLGASPEVEQAVKDIIEENLTEYFEHEYKLK